LAWRDEHGPGSKESEAKRRMSDQAAIAADLKAVPPLPEIELLRESAANLPAPPPQIIEGVSTRGTS